jgi:hypothetical protein
VSEGEVDLLNVRRATSRREGTREGGCGCVCAVDKEWECELGLGPEGVSGRGKPSIS